MFLRMVCVSIYTSDIKSSLEFYNQMGLVENWRLTRTLETGIEWTLVGLKFPTADSSELVLSDHPNNKFTEIEIQVHDVEKTYNKLKKNSEIHWIRKPFSTESNSVAVMEAPDGNIFVLISNKPLKGDK